jgi:hypothetical protein
MEIRNRNSGNRVWEVFLRITVPGKQNTAPGKQNDPKRRLRRLATTGAIVAALCLSYAGPGLALVLLLHHLLAHFPLDVVIKWVCEILASL